MPSAASRLESRAIPSRFNFLLKHASGMWAVTCTSESATSSHCHSVLAIPGFRLGQRLCSPTRPYFPARSLRSRLSSLSGVPARGTARTSLASISLITYNYDFYRQRGPNTTPSEEELQISRAPSAAVRLSAAPEGVSSPCFEHSLPVNVNGRAQRPQPLKIGWYIGGQMDVNFSQSLHRFTLVYIW
jgi:hypothetical protein